MPASTKHRVPVDRHHKPFGLASVRIEGHDTYLGPTARLKAAQSTSA